MIFNIIIKTTVLMLCTGKSTTTAVSTTNCHREDILSDTNMHFYDNNVINLNSNGRRNKKDHVFHQRSRNIQYAPLVLKPIDEVREYTKTTESDGDPPIIEADINRNTISKYYMQPQFNEQRYVNNKRNKLTTPSQHFGGYNIKMFHGNELKPEYGNNVNDNSDRNINIRSNIDDSYSNAILSEKHTLMTPISNNSPDTSFHAPRSSVKHIMQGLPASENTKLHLILNPYYVKIPRIHVNMAQRHSIAHNQNKAIENGNIKRIHFKNYKEKFVPDIDVLLERKRFLYPTNNL